MPSRCEGRPVLDPLGLVEHDDVRAKTVENRGQVADYLLVVGDQETGPGAPVDRVPLLL